MSAVSEAGTVKPAGSDGSGLQKGALGFLDAVVMGVAGSAPAYSISSSAVAIVLAVGFGTPAALLYCGIPMLGIAVAYHHLNKLSAEAGAAYAWVGRVLHPGLGFLCGWALVVSALLFMVSGSLPAGQVTLSLFSQHLSTETGWVTAVGALWFLVMAYFVARGVRITANAQWIMSTVEVLLLVVFGILGIIHAHKAVNFSWGWFGFSHFSGFSGFVGGALVAAFFYWGWDVASNLSEETAENDKNSGFGGIAGVLIVFALYELMMIVINMDLSQKTITKGPANVLEALGNVIWSGPGGKLLIIAVMLSTIATLETTLIQVTRSLFAMARERTLPNPFGRLHPDWHTPVFATIVVGCISLLLFLASNFIGSVDKILTDSIDAIGLQIAVYYGLAGLCAVIAFRRQVLNSTFNFVFMGAYPLVGALFMFWIFGEAIPNQSLIVNAMGLGLLLLGLVPLVFYWTRGSEFLRSRPTLGATPVAQELPKELIEEILPEYHEQD